MEEQTTVMSQPAETTTETTTTTDSGFNFNSALSAEYQDHPSIQKFNGDVNNLAKSYLSLEQMMGQGRVAIPKDADDQVAWDMYDKAFKVGEYNIQVKEGKEQEYNTAEFTEIMKKNHISPAAAQNIFDYFASSFEGQEQNAIAAEQQKMDDTINTLKSEWGAKYKSNLELANNTLSKFCADQDEYNHLLSVLGNDSSAIRVLNKIGAAMSEGSVGGFEGQVSGFAKTPSEAKAEFDRIMADKDDAYWAGSRNRRNDMAWCKANNATYVSEDERKARVQYVQSLIRMQG